MWFVTAAAGVLAGADGIGVLSAGGASAEELVARALEVIDRQSARIDELARQNAVLREQNAALRELVAGIPRTSLHAWASTSSTWFLGATYGNSVKRSRSAGGMLMTTPNAGVGH